jgi:hypothetical protein
MYRFSGETHRKYLGRDLLHRPQGSSRRHARGPGSPAPVTARTLLERMSAGGPTTTWSSTRLRNGIILSLLDFPGLAGNFRRAHCPLLGDRPFNGGNGPSTGALTVIVSQDPIFVTFPVSQKEFLQATVMKGCAARANRRKGGARRKTTRGRSLRKYLDSGARPP